MSAILITLAIQFAFFFIVIGRAGPTEGVSRGCLSDLFDVVWKIVGVAVTGFLPLVALLLLGVALGRQP